MPCKVMPWNISGFVSVSWVQHLQGLIWKKKNQVPGINLYENKDNILFDPNG